MVGSDIIWSALWRNETVAKQMYRENLQTEKQKGGHCLWAWKESMHTHILVGKRCVWSEEIQGKNP